MDLTMAPAMTVSSTVGVREVPEPVRSLSTIAEPDYVDLFTIATPVAAQRSAEGWSRAVLEEAPVSQRNARLLWHLVGLRLGPRGSADHIQGWSIAERGDNWIRAETSSWYLTAQAVCLVGDEHVSVSLSLRYDQPLVGRLVWAAVSGPHRRALPVMLRQAARLVEVGSGRRS